MRQKYAVEDVDITALAARHHGGDEISGTVVAESSSLVPGGTVVCTRDVRDVMFQVMYLEAKFVGASLKMFRDQLADVPHFLFPSAQTDKVQQFGWVGKCVSDFL